MNKRFYSIELLRFLASLAVILYHYKIGFAWDKGYVDTVNLSLSLPFYKFINLFYNYGFYGVQLFFLISGFVFAHIYINKKNLVSLKEFFINRFARLYPLHFATLILVTFLQLFSLGAFDTFQIIQINDFYHFFLNLMFISSWGFENGHSFNAPIWSVSVEVAIYILFFFLLSLIKKYKLIFIILISVILLLIDKMKIFDTLFLECARLFFSGTIIYYLLNMKLNNYIYLISSLILILLAFIGNFKTFVFCPALVLFFVAIDIYIKNKSYQLAFRKLGNLTYSLYLLHLPFQILILIIWKIIGIEDVIFTKFYFLISFFVILIFVANLCFKLFEKPLNELIRKKFK